MYINTWTDKQNVLYIHNGPLFSLKKKKEGNSDTRNIDKLENIMLSEVNQTPKEKYGMISLHEIF